MVWDDSPGWDADCTSGEVDEVTVGNGGEPVRDLEELYITMTNLEKINYRRKLYIITHQRVRLFSGVYGTNRHTNLVRLLTRGNNKLPCNYCTKTARGCLKISSTRSPS